jgi:hypothetical protein
MSAEALEIFKAVVTQWRASSSGLSNIEIRTTRIPADEVEGQLPYCLFASQVIQRKFCSGDYRLTWYRVSLTIYGKWNKGQLAAITNAMQALFDRNIGLPVLDTCYVLEVRNDDEFPAIDDADYYGADVNKITVNYRVLLSESIYPIHLTTAT